MLGALFGVAAVAQLARVIIPWQYRPLFVDVARNSGQDENLLHAIAWHESGVNPNAISGTNKNGTRDFGMMQINETNFLVLGLNHSNVFDPSTNVAAAAMLIDNIRAASSRPLSLSEVASIYNSGSRLDGTPHRDSTERFYNTPYVLSVITKRWWIRLASFSLSSFAGV